MAKAKNAAIWTEAGYELFAREGLDAIQIERLSRLLQLNKSGFYHYFGDLEVFFMELLRLHRQKANRYLADIREVTTIDPGYFQVVVKHKVPVMFHMQLFRTKNRPEFTALAQTIDDEEEVIMGELWTAYLGFKGSSDAAIRYFNLVRDMINARMSFQNLDVEFLRASVTEAKVTIQNLAFIHAEVEIDQMQY